MAKELTLEQVKRNGGVVQLDQRLAAAGTGIVDCVSDEFFPGSGLCLNEDCKNALGHDSEQPGVFPSENCDHEPGAPCRRRREWTGRWVSPSLRAREPCRRSCDRHWAQEARHLPPQAERSSRWRLRRLPRSAFHHGRELCASTKAEYICADQPVASFFACDKAADHTFRLAVSQPESELAEPAACSPVVLGPCCVFPRWPQLVVAESCARTRRLLFVHLPQTS
jgi:hypothetical protein